MSKNSFEATRTSLYSGLFVSTKCISCQRALAKPWYQDDIITSWRRQVRIKLNDLNLHLRFVRTSYLSAQVCGSVWYFGDEVDKRTARARSPYISCIKDIVSYQVQACCELEMVLVEFSWDCMMKFLLAELLVVIFWMIVSLLYIWFLLDAASTLFPMDASLPDYRRWPSPT